MTKDYYEVLEVSPAASQGAIDAVYRRLALTYHPDVNPSPDAAERMKDINEAYQVLGDPTRRAEYDNAFFKKEAAPPRQQPVSETQAPRTPPFACEGCGRVDASLRATVFLYVYSILILSFRRGGGAGILCSSCRLKRAIPYTLVALLFGPWGVPWGILWTVEAFLTNLTGGKQPPEVNAPLLRILGAYFLSVGDNSAGLSAFEASLRFKDDRELRAAVEKARSRQTEEGGVRGATRGTSLAHSPLFIIGVGVLLVCSILVLAGIFSGQAQPVSLGYMANSTAYALPIVVNPSTSLAPTLSIKSAPSLAATLATNTWSPWLSPVMAYVTPIPEQLFYVCAQVANVRTGPGTNYSVN